MSDVIKSCDYAIAIDPLQVKAYYRRAKARPSSELGQCLEDLNKAHNLSPGDIEI